MLSALPSHDLDADQQLTLLSHLTKAGVRLLPVINHPSGRSAPKWIDGMRLTEAGRGPIAPGVAEQLGMWMRGFHAAGKQLVPPSVDDAGWAEHYAKVVAVRTGSSTIPADISVGWIHSDLHPGNLIAAKSGNEWILKGVIDWEYARIGWTLFDLGDVLWRACMWHHLGGDHDVTIINSTRRLIDAYEATPADRLLLPSALTSLLELRIGFLERLVGSGGNQFVPALRSARQMETALVERHDAFIGMLDAA